MGWWKAGGGEDTVWGDEPADILDDALDKIRQSFEREWNRPPCKEELLAGLKFSLPWFDAP